MERYLTLNNFRNYKYSKIDIDSSCNIFVVYGENGQGKTNILEAISMFGGENGLRKAKSVDIINKFSSDEQFWSVQLQFDSDCYTTGYMNNKRIHKVSDKNVRNLNSFAKNYYVLWMTYATDRLFVESSANRRDFIDMFCNSQFKDHETNLKTYEKLARERMKILKRCEGVPKTESFEKWLDVIEERIVSVAIEVMKARNKIIECIENSQGDEDFPRFTNKMVSSNDIDIENPDIYKKELKERRQRDFFSNYTSAGPNRSDWKVFHTEKQIDASMCSAGEQKILILGVFLGFIRHNIQHDNRNLILILDDVIAHLDSCHRVILFKHLKSLQKFFETNDMKIMIWLSGIEKGLFAEFYDEACFFEVNNGEISRG